MKSLILGTLASEIKTVNLIPILRSRDKER